MPLALHVEEGRVRELVSVLDEAQWCDDQKAMANYGALGPTIYQIGTTRQLG